MMGSSASLFDDSGKRTSCLNQNCTAVPHTYIHTHKQRFHYSAVDVLIQVFQSIQESEAGAAVYCSRNNSAKNKAERLSTLV